MGRLKRLALWGCAVLMAVTAVAVGELDPTWATSPTDAAREAGVSDAGGPPGPAAGLPAKAGPRSYGLPGLVLASSHCQHGQWSSGRCRACPVGQVWITGTGCVAATSTRRCSSGNTYFSSYGGCRPTTCANGRTSTGTCRPACSAGQSYFSSYGGCRPSSCANGRTSTGTCRPACPSGQTYFSSYGGCRPSSCANGRTSTGTCRPCPSGQSYFSSYGGCRPSSCANGRTSTGTCRTCPSGQSYFSSYGGCRPSSCANGRTSTGTCRPCPSGQSYFSSYGGCRPTTCKNGRRSNGTCRSCADPTHMRRDGACRPKLVPAATDPACPAGQLYYSSYGGCRPATCANGRISTGACRPACPAGRIRLPAVFGTACVPANCAYGRTSTGACRACPAGQTQLPAFGTMCVPENCTYGYTNTGTCEAASPNHRYPTLKCSTYSADASAQEYLDVYRDKLDRATCPPRELFLASTGTEDWPTWGFQKTVAKYFGKVVVEESGDCSGGLRDTGDWWDFRVPCKAHDHCFDLRRAGLTGTVTDGDCDDLLKSLMDADCKDRPEEDMRLCSMLSGFIRLAQRFVNQGPNPGPVKIVNVNTGKCASIKSGSHTDGTKVVQQTCGNSSHQQFRLHPSGRYPGYFLVKPAHSNKCIEIATASLVQMSCVARRPTLDPRWAKQAFRLTSVSNSDIYQISSKSARSSCWTVPYTDSSRNSLKPVVNQANGVQLANTSCSSSKDSQKWSIRSASYTALPPPTPAPTTSTGDP